MSVSKLCHHVVTESLAKPARTPQPHWKLTENVEKTILEKV